MRGLDHLVLCVGDLVRARAVYGAMGFTMTPRARHPFGTGNSLAQFDGNFLELLTVVAPGGIPPHDPAKGRFSFGRFNADFLARHEGMAMLVLTSDDARADLEDFKRRGLTAHAPFEFSREALQPDGSKATVGFSLAFASDGGAPNLGFFTCQQRAPEYFWKPEYQTHANGALGIAEVFLAAAEPAARLPFLAAFIGQGARLTKLGTRGFSLSAGGGAVTVLGHDAAEERLGWRADGDDARFAGFALSVADLDQTRRALAGGGVPFGDLGVRLLLAPDDLFGCAVEFRKTAV